MREDAAHQHRGAVDAHDALASSPVLASPCPTFCSVPDMSKAHFTKYGHKSHKSQVQGVVRACFNVEIVPEPESALYLQGS